MPKPDGLPLAVVVSGGKQYRVAPGDRILVDRIGADPGASVKLGRVLLFSSDGGVKVGAPVVDGVDVEAKVIAHERGPRVESIRYKSKKRVRVHRGGRADLTALEIIAVGGIGLQKEERKEAPRPKKGRSAKPAARKKAAPEAEIVAAEPEPDVEAAAEKPKKAARRTTQEKGK